MLVVVAVIVLLISILLPSLGYTKHAAKSVACRTNMVVIYSASTAYAQSHQGRIPASRSWVGSVRWKN